MLPAAIREAFEKENVLPEAVDESVYPEKPNASARQYGNAPEKVVGVAECGYFVGNAGTVIQESLATIGDANSSPAAIKTAFQNIDSVSVKMKETAPAIISTVATVNKKVKGCKKGLKKIQQEQKRKKARFQAAKKKKKSDALIAVEEFVPVQKSDSFIEVKEAAVLLSPGAAPPVRRSSPRTSVLPAPANGIHYDRVETWRILRCCKNEKEIEAAKSAMFPDGKEPFIPAGRRQLNRFWKQHKHRLTPPFPACWGRSGRPVFVSLDDLTERLLEKLEGYEDNSVGREDFLEVIRAARIETIEAKGGDPRGEDLSISDETLDSYITAVQGTAGVKLSENVREKPTSRRDAECSPRNTATQMFASAVGQSIALAGPVPSDRKLQENVSQGAKDLYSLVQAAEGNDNICPLDPHLLTSKDEYTFHAAFGAHDEVVELRMTLKKSTGKKHSVHKSVKPGENSSSNRFRGATVSGYTLTTGAGEMAPILLTTKRLSPEQLPSDKCPEGIVIIPVQHLGPGGDTDPYNKSIGYVAFIREDKNIEVDLFKEHFERIHAPFLRQIRTNGGLPANHATSPPAMRSLNMHDGGMTGLFAMTSEEILDQMAPLQEWDMKHPAGCSLIFQPEDLRSSYRTFKQAVKKTKKRKRDGVASSSRAAGSFKKGLDEAKTKYGLNLGFNIEKSWMSLVAEINRLINHAFGDSDVLRDGFVSPGYLDEGAHQYPDMYKILKQCKTKLPPGFIDAYITAYFTELYLEMRDKGEISEGTFDRIDKETGIDTRDRDASGDVIEMKATIASEWRQRGKISSSPEQRRLRLEIAAMVEEQAMADHEREKHKREEYFQLARQCEALLGVIENASLEAYAQVSPAPLLEAFVKVRECTSAAKRGEYKMPPRKGDVEKARRCISIHALNPSAPLGKEDCTVYRAYMARGKPWKMQPLPDALPEHEPTHHRGSGPRRNPVVVDAGLSGSEVLPSALLEDETWLEAARKGELRGADFSREITGEMKENADALLSLLRTRLWEHKRARLKNESKYDHWSMALFEANLARLCALRVLGGSVKPDLKSSRHNSCYLTSPRKGGFVDSLGESNVLFGSYLFWDDEESVWVRSGKAYGEAGSTIGNRHGEHIEGSKLGGPKSSDRRFYRYYPCRVNARLVVSDTERRGYFQNLRSYIGLAFDPSASASLTDGEGGLFVWSDLACEKLQASNDSCTNLVSSKLNMVSYMAEKLDDLMIPDQNNVSDSFGFEVYGLQFA